MFILYQNLEIYFYKIGIPPFLLKYLSSSILKIKGWSFNYTALIKKMSKSFKENSIEYRVKKEKERQKKVVST